MIINYMYDFINRGISMADPTTIASFDPILGGPGWNDRLDPHMAAIDRGMAVEKLFRDTLKNTGGFEFVVSTKIYRPTIDRPLARENRIENTWGAGNRKPQDTDLIKLKPVG